jgi:DNA-binding response OmpR family regulator
MNASLSDENEPVIDIFILSANPPLSAQLEKQLREEGYYVTLFSDGTHLLETLRNGKPNLLMCDTTVSDADAFDVCRQIKADDYLWNIPVLIITGAFDLGDLLRVLDCNADNFIAHPFDPPYLLSLLEGMLTVPVERQTPEQIKTQFKIKHDDQVFVVTADRRKLLEFLLSSFEIAVNKSTELSRSLEDNRNLGTTIRKLEETVQENTKVIGIINESLKSKEQKIAELTGQLSDREETVREKIEAVARLESDISSVKSAHDEARNEIQRVVREKDESSATHKTTIDQLQRQVTDLSSELAIVKPALERANGELARESTLRKETGDELLATAAGKELAEKSLSALTTEFEQLKINFGTEKNRAEEAENELRAVLQAKNQSEQDLTQIINDLKSTATQQAATLTRLKEELDTGNARLLETEENLNAVTAAKEQSESSLQATLNERQKYLIDLQAWLDTAKSQLDEKERVLAALNEEIATVRSAKESAEHELASVSCRLAETDTALETERRNIASQKEDLARVYDEKEKADSLAESLAGSLKELRATVDEERNRAGENEKQLNLLILQRERELGELRTTHDDTRTALSSHTTALEQVNRDLESAVSAREELAANLQAAEEKVRNLAEELARASANRDEEKRKFQSLANEVEHIKTSLETETLRRQEAEDQLRDALSQQQRQEQDLERLSADAKNLHADLSAEQRMHEAAKKRNEFLEAQVSSLNREKSEAEKAAADLSAEIDQARTALADEWEDHMTDKERLAATAEKKPLLPPPVPYSGVKREAEIIKKRSLIVKVPNIPSEIRPLPRSMVAIDPVKAKEPESSSIRSVEDLYEDDDEGRENADSTPEVSIVQEPDTEPVRDVLPDGMYGRSASPDSFFEETGDTGSDIEDPDDESTSRDERSSLSLSGQNIAFDRTRWLDLLKWSHHCDVLEPEQRMHIVRLGRLIQKGRKLTKNQEEQVLEMITLVKSLGYRMP